ncbi:TPA: ead/Ea22-like family protein [Klebsiella variicola]|nr:ead/Ea22-like family protein [Klebsiella variicola]
MTDITELAQRMKAAAEKATPGRIGDRIDGSGSIKYQCFGNDGSLVLQTDHKNMEYGFIGPNAEADELFFRECAPANILALVEALEKAQQHENEWKSLCEAAAVDLDDWREIDDKSRDLLCKLADTVIAKAEQSAEWERKAISNFEDCAEMSARLEELESQRKLAFAASNRWADKFREAEKRIAELESRIVKLPLPSCTYADHSYPAYSKRQVISLLESLGITVVEGDV